MELKQKIIAITITLVAATSALAETEKIVPAANTFGSTELTLLFDQDGQSLRAIALSEQEMKTTVGAYSNNPQFSDIYYKGISFETYSEAVSYKARGYTYYVSPRGTSYWSNRGPIYGSQTAEDLRYWTDLRSRGLGWGPCYWSSCW